MYYRLAMRSKTSPDWHWKSTVLTSLEAVLRLLRLYQALPHDRLLVCSAPSRERLNEMLRRANDGLESSAVTAIQFLHAGMPWNKGEELWKRGWVETTMCRMPLLFHGLFHTCSPGHGCLPASNAGNYSHKLHVSNEPCRKERSRRYDGNDEARRR